jgi:hypothetical protein
MEIIKSIHHYSAILFSLNALLLSIIFLFTKQKSNKIIKIMVKTEWFVSSFMFFLGLILLFIHSYWFQVGLFHIKISIAMFAIGASQYFYKQYTIALFNDTFPKYLNNIRIIIPILVIGTYYAGKMLYYNF